VMISAGRTDAGGRALLPAELRGAPAAPAPERVRLGPYVALRYRAVRAADSSRAYRVYAVPTSIGTATVVCGAPAATLPAIARACERTAGTLRLRAGRAFPADATGSHARDVDRVLAALRRDRAQAIGRMSAATSPVAESAAASDAGRAYDRAATAIAALDVSPYDRPTTERVTEALTAADRAYARLAQAAGAADGSGYAAARTAVRRAEAAAQGAVGAYGRTGYAVTT
jgi:hypothetical protein